MVRAAWKPAAILIVLSGASSACWAQDVSGLMGGEPRACFTRAYTDDHLAGHPDQNVRSIRAGVSNGAGGAYELSIDIEFRGGSSTKGRLMADCRPGGSGYALRCLARCDGSRVDIKIRDADTIRLEIPEAAQLERGGSCDPSSASGSGALWSDDKVFRLSRAGSADCPYGGSADRPGTALPDMAPSADGPMDDTRQ
ncbi:hypothetical protein [Pararhizobium sp.]|uniref:hypothetical protein n=1 Tax=Pararhizobium sp. TaxID=1977563 RepID=UPI0027163BD4|nr:hypothetical protein [Pararhizobium sp.]MDO9417487.1 hypothetical protein [Pararhizobium sp.]